MANVFDTFAENSKVNAVYEPLFEIGRGGMGVVQVAKALGAGGFERLVVIKRLHKHLLKNQEAVNRFLDEARQAATLHHANVVAVQQVCRDEQGYFLILDYVEGASVEELIDRAYLKRTRIPAPVVIRIVLDVLEGLDAVHNAADTSGNPLGMLHRDISIQNILVGKDGVARITDFGIAKSTAASVSTDKEYLVGKLLYMPREALQRVEPSPALDIYALGVAMWIMITGTDPWPKATEAQIVEHVLHDRIPPLSSAGLKVAPQIEQFIHRACEPDISKRFRTARQMADELERVTRGTGWMATRAEVTEFVLDLVGDDLAARRQRIAEILDDPTRSSKAKLVPSMPPPSSLASSAPTAGDLSLPPQHFRKPTRVQLFIGLGSVALISLLLLAIRILHPLEKAPHTAPTSSTKSPTSSQPSPSAPSSSVGIAEADSTGNVRNDAASGAQQRDAAADVTVTPSPLATSSHHPKQALPQTTSHQPQRPVKRQTNHGIVRHNPYR